MRFLRPLPVFYALVLSLLLSLLAFWSSQWWLPKLTPALLERVDVAVESVERTDAGRMRLEGLRYQSDDGLQLTADFVELPNVWDYAGGRWFAAEWQQSQQLELGVVSIQLQSQDSSKDSKDSEAGAIELPGIFELADRNFAKVKPWLPPLHVGELSLLNAEGGALVRLEDLRLDDTDVEAKLYARGKGQAYPVALSLGSGKWSINAAAPDLALEVRANLEGSREQFALNAILTHAGRPIYFEAVWRGSGIIPDSAMLQAEDVAIPQHFVEGLGSNEIEATRISRADLQWNGDRYEGELELAANLNVEGHQLVAIALAAVEGDTRELRLRKLKVDSPWANAVLEAPLAIRLSELEFEKAADFRVSADLSKQPFVSASGVLEGSLSFEPPAQIRFELDGRSVQFQEYPAGDLVLAGTVDKEGLKLEKLRAVFAEPGAAEVEVSGSMNFQKSLIDFDYDVSMSPQFATAFGFPDLLRESCDLNGSVKGEISALRWSVNLKAPAVQPPDMRVFEANGNLSGTGVSDIRIDAALVNERERLGFIMKLAELGGSDLRGSFERFLWEVDEETRFSLEKPSHFVVPMQGTISQRFKAAGVGSLILSGPGIKWTLQKSSEGPLSFSGRQFKTAWLGSWLDRQIPPYEIQSADVVISELSPLLTGKLSLSVMDPTFELGALQLVLRELRFGERIELQSLRVALGEESVLESVADLPIRLKWAETEKRPTPEFEREGPMRILVDMPPSQTVSGIIRQYSELSVESPRLNLEINGTVKSPSGHLEAFVASIKLPETNGERGKQVEIPDLNEVELRAELDGKTLRLTKLKAAIRGGYVEGSGTWPIEIFHLFEASEQADWLAGALRGSFELSLSEWELQNWTPYLPSMLRRTGVLGGTLRHGPDSGFGGDLSFKELGLRPTQNLPSVDSANGSLSFEGRTLKVVKAGARVGGSPVSLLGQVDFADWPEVIWWAEIEGKNVPVVRTPEMILRSDLDLRLSQERDQSVPNLVGRMGLRSSTMLVEFDPLSPAVRSGPSSKPPFFAIEEEPFNQWGLDLRIEGERFLRVRSPYFQSVLSAGLDLKGRLGEPLLLGSIRIEEGSLSFPGAKMRVDAGEAYIESGQPDALQLDVTGTARTGTHVITMDVSGTASDPQIQFDATPPLPNASIVRLLSTGSTTGGGAGSVGLYLGRGLLGAGGMDESFADRITIDVGEERTRSGKNTMGVRYDLNEEMYLNGEYDVFDNYNTDLLWMIFEK